MIDRDTIIDIIKQYNEPIITAIGSHSALEIMDGAKDEGLKTLVICQKGREKPYQRFRRIIDDLIILDRFDDMLKPEIQMLLRSKNAIVIPHRSFVVYLGYDAIEQNLTLPLFGSRGLLRAEERTIAKNQYYLLEKARIKHPRILKPEEIDCPAIVKVQEADRKLERAFFIVNSYEDYERKAEERIKANIIDREELNNSVIEELAIGTYFNFNYFNSLIDDNVEFLGIERRLQTNMYDYINMPAKHQLDIDIELQNIEIGHMPASIRESMLEQVIEIGDRFVEACKDEYYPGMIGPFSLQSVVTKDLEIIVYDVSFRVPGNPILATTSPYTKYMHGEVFGVGRRIAMEIKKAFDANMLDKIVT
jgi:5-formaminoimidazole-4-carboxamide-1-(beta)-D-ribofuranosyl 5'-monophosphate synthetase